MAHRKIEEIYLPEYAKKQLETYDNSRFRTRPMPYSPIPTQDHPYKLRLIKDELNINPIIDDEYFYPEKTDTDNILERLEEIVKKHKPHNNE